VYSPLAIKARRNRAKLFAYIGLIFFLSGLWHGANWTYICWGMSLALCIVIERLFENIVKPQKFINRRWRGILGTMVTFLACVIFSLFFRAQNMRDAIHILKTIVIFQPGNLFQGSPPINFYYCVIAMVTLYTVEFFQEYLPRVKLINNNSVVIRYAGYVLVIMIMLMIGVFNGTQFIYFQF
jgi:D-alanyl-lipoteichoic acid acyltransferase DltB (MBOAT superfamily)